MLRACLRLFSSLVRNLGLTDGPEPDVALDKVFDQYGRPSRHRYRLVVYCLLAWPFGRESVYG
ncbi:MAG: DUF2853 family protein [Pseudomonadota bacterium]